MCRIADRICGQPYVIEGHKIAIGVSIGSALYPSIATSRSDPLRIADEKMYRMKRKKAALRENYLESVPS